MDDSTRGNGAMHYIGAGIMGKLYAGLAWEFEFGSKACASFDGMSTLSPSLRGGSALLELGYRFAPKSSRVSYGLNFAG